MDPDEVLRNMVERARGLIATSDDVEVLKLSDEVLDMHDWLSKGGFLPAAWTATASGRVRG